MKILTFSVKTQQRCDEAPTRDRASTRDAPTDLPGFLRERFIPALPSKLDLDNVEYFKIIIEDDDLQLIYNNQKSELSKQQTVKINNINLEIKREALYSEKQSVQEIEKVKIKEIEKEPKIYTVPKISNDYALMNDHFSASTPISGDILRDLGFENENGR